MPSSAGGPIVLVRDLIESGEAEVTTGPFGTQFKASEYVEKGIPMVNVINVGFGEVRTENLAHVSDETVRRLSKHVLEAGDILFGRKGAVERHAYVKESQAGWIQGSDCIRLRLRSPRLMSRFVSYALLTERHKQWMVNHCSHGATMASLNQDIVSRIGLPLRDPAEQARVVAVLDGYANLIENNTRRIQILEEMAQTIYREWFVEFRFPGHADVPLVESELGPTPNGWEVRKVKDTTVRLKPRRTYRGEEVERTGSVPVVDQSKEELLGFHSNRADVAASAEDPVILFGDHTCRMRIMTVPHSIGPNVVLFRPTEGIPALFLFHVVRGRVVTREYKRHWSDLMGKLVLIPPSGLSGRFADLILPPVTLAQVLETANRNLRATRDFLLPRLISGDVDVSDLDIDTSGLVA